MNDAGLWVTPLLLLPGVALMVLSTSVRYNRLHDEIHDLMGAHADLAGPGVLALLARRARLFRLALVCLYASVALLSLASLVGVASVAAGGWVARASYGITGTAVLTVLVASVALVVESRGSLDVIEDHLTRAEAGAEGAAARGAQGGQL
ncbi:MAG: DUF2721 domain-containing protein [Gemmatimonadetes bacterium]|nr:MAG: DUF2721 domain-containing protein [Gemmatimonadota bacterium]